MPFSEGYFGQRINLTLADGLDCVNIATHTHTRINEPRALDVQRKPGPTRRLAANPAGMAEVLVPPARGGRPKVGSGVPQSPA